MLLATYSLIRNLNNILIARILEYFLLLLYEVPYVSDHAFRYV